MIQKLAFYFANFFACKGAYNVEKILIYQYGFELLISTVLNTFFILIIALLTHRIIEVLFFCLSFVPLRSVAGGYHTKHHWSCILSFTVVLLGCVSLLKFFGLETSASYTLGAATLSAIIVWKLAPVEANNKPLNDIQHCAQRKKSRAMITINFLVALLFFTIDTTSFQRILCFYISGAFIASLSLAVAKISAHYYS